MSAASGAPSTKADAASIGADPRTSLSPPAGAALTDNTSSSSCSPSAPAATNVSSPSLSWSLASDDRVTGRAAIAAPAAWSAFC